MKRPFVYVCSRYDGSKDTPIEDIRRAGRYCRQLYELGFTPIAPQILYPQFLGSAIPTEKRDFRDISMLLLRRCSALVMCDSEPDCGMLDLIQTAQRHHMLCTTLDSLLVIQAAVHHSKPEPAENA